MNAVIFAKRLKLLRLTHRLKSNTLGALVGAPGNGSIGKLEKGRSQPSFTPLTGVAKLFAVSLDWLVGRIDEPYQEGIIANEEENLFPVYAMQDGRRQEIVPLRRKALIEDFDPKGEGLRKREEEVLVLDIPDDYKDIALRRNTYSLALRADIIYTIYLLKYLVDRHPEVIPALPNNTDSIRMNGIKEQPGSHSIAEQCRLCYSWLYEIWWTDRKKAPIDCQTPLFDITSKSG